MLKLALIALLHFGQPTERRYAMRDYVANNPYTVRDAFPTPAPAPKLYSTQQWQAAVERETKETKVCQCLTLIVSPDGHVLGSSKPCACGE